VDECKPVIGGPNGSLQVEPDAMDHVVLTAGGIGVTPMAAILEVGGCRLTLSIPG
jgi:ferredoxin-NADP reductase